MREISVSIPLLAMVVWTRAMGAAGVALLASDRLTPEQRRAVGWTLMLVGAMTTIPLAAEVLGKLRRAKPTLAET